VRSINGDEQLGEFMFQALQRLMPTGTSVDQHTINDRIGAIILARAIYHLSREDEFQLRILLVLFISVVGPSTGLREPKQSYIELLQQLN